MENSPAEIASACESLSAYISARFESFSRSQRDVARYIVDHLEETIFLTAEELAKQANTSSSTVVRFSQALGFEGYPELQQAIREEYRRRPVDGSSVPSTVPIFSLDQSQLEAAMAADYENVEKTARKLTPDQVASAIAVINSAQRVLIVGADQMAFFASYLRHLLNLLDIRAELVASPSQEGLNKLARIDKRTLVIVLSAGRAHPLLTRALKLASHRSANTLAFCDATLTEVAQLAQVSLYYSSNTPAFIRSHTALLSLIQSVVFGVYSASESQHKDRIKAYRLK